MVCSGHIFSLLFQLSITALRYDSQAINLIALTTSPPLVLLCLVTFRFQFRLQRERKQICLVTSAHCFSSSCEMAAATGSLPPHQDFGPACLGITWTTLALAVIAVTLRAYSRLSSKSWGLDDYAIVMALGLAIFGDIIATLQVNAGWGQQYTNARIHLTAYSLLI